MNIYERLGKTIEERDGETAAHFRSLRLIHQLKRGDVTIDEVTLTDNGWTLEPVGDNGAGDLMRAVAPKLVDADLRRNDMMKGEDDG